MGFNRPGRQSLFVQHTSGFLSEGVISLISSNCRHLLTLFSNNIIYTQTIVRYEISTIHPDLGNIRDDDNGNNCNERVGWCGGDRIRLRQNCGWFSSHHRPNTTGKRSRHPVGVQLFQPVWIQPPNSLPNGVAQISNLLSSRCVELLNHRMDEPTTCRLRCQLSRGWLCN